MRPPFAWQSVSGRCAQRQAGQRWGPRPCGLLEPRAFLIRRPAAASLLGLQTPHSSPHGPRGPMPDPGLMGLQFPPGALAGESVSRPLDLPEPPAPLGSWPFLTALPSSQPAREVALNLCLRPQGASQSASEKSGILCSLEGPLETPLHLVECKRVFVSVGPWKNLLGAPRGSPACRGSFGGRRNKPETPVLWPPHTKS